MNTGVLAAKACHHLTFDQWRGPRHAWKRAQSIGHVLIVVNFTVQFADLIGNGKLIDRDMGIGAQNSIDQLAAEARAHRQCGDQRKYGQRDSDQADPGHQAYTALGAAGAQEAPSDHPFKSGKRGGVA